MWSQDVPELEMTRTPKDLVFGKPRYKEPRATYPWKSTALGRWCLCLIYVYARNFGTDDQHLHNSPGKLGIKADGMEKFIRVHCPEVFDEYEAATGNQLTGEIMMSRFGNMFRENDNKTFAMGKEHPKNHKDLRPVLNMVYQYEIRYRAENGSF